MDADIRGSNLFIILMNSSVLEDRILLIGIDFRTAPVDVRESIRLDDEMCDVLHQRVKFRLPGLQLFTLSTCNRTEFLLVSPEGEDLATVSQSFLGELRLLKPNAKILHKSCYRYQESGRNAIRRIMSVATGLLSSIVGDQQILGQFKQSVRMSGESGLMGGELDAILKAAVRAGKRVRRETSLCCGNSSLGGLVSRKIEAWCKRKNLNTANICIVGAGDVARELVFHLRKIEGPSIFIFNRTLAKAKELAETCGGTARWLDEFDKFADTMDVIVGAAQADEPFITRDSFRDQLEMGKRLYVDLGVPRNIEDDLGVDRFNIDTLEREVGETKKLRENEIPQVERIIEEEMERWISEAGAASIEQALKTLFCEVDDSLAGDRDEFEMRVKRALQKHARALRTGYKLTA